MGIGVAAQFVAGFKRHLRRARRVGDAAGAGQRLDEAALALGGPAIVPRAQGDGGEFREGAGGRGASRVPSGATSLGIGGRWRCVSQAG